MNTVKEKDKVCVITEGEFDAMAVHQQTGLPCVSLPNGANGLPTDLLEFFDRFERIYLWLDADEVGQNAVEKFAKKLGIGRTLVVNTLIDDLDGPKDANEALLKGCDFSKIFREKTINLGDVNLLSLNDLRDKVIHRIVNQNKIIGIPSTCF